MRCGNFRKAAELGFLYRQRGFKNWYVTLNLAISLARSHFNNFNEILKIGYESINESNNNPLAIISLAEIMLSTGNWEEGLKILENIYFKDKEKFDYYLWQINQVKCQLLSRIGKFTAAEKILSDWPITKRDWRWKMVLADMEIQKSNWIVAEDIYKDLLKKNPHSKIYNFNLGLVLLSQKKCKEAWPFYEWRNKNPRQGADGIPCKLPTIDSLKGKRVLVKSEMGIGDQIMMGRYLKDLSSIVSSLTICLSTRLKNLYQRSLPKNIEFITSSDFEKNDFDEIIGTGSLAGIFWEELELNLKNSNFLLVDSKKVDQWSKYLAKYQEKKKIGIAWRGGTTGADHRERSLNKNDINSLSSWENSVFFDIQFLNSEENYPEYLTKNKNIIRIDRAGFDLDESIALIKALDYVITPRQTIAHLIGSINEQGSVLVPKRQEWRYWEQENNWEWYPNVDYQKQRDRDSWLIELNNIRDKI